MKLSKSELPFSGEYMGNLALSADGEIKLYHANQNILDAFDDLLDEFYGWKKTKWKMEKQSILR